MKDIINGLIERFRRQHVQARRYVAMMLVLALLTTLFVNWQLHGVGISMTADYHCGYEEHQHTAACYEKVLTCGYEEGELENEDEVAAAAATSTRPSGRFRFTPGSLARVFSRIRSASASRFSETAFSS